MFGNLLKCWNLYDQISVAFKNVNYDPREKVIVHCDSCTQKHTQK